MQPPRSFWSLASDNTSAWLLELESKSGPPPQGSRKVLQLGWPQEASGRRGLHLGLERRIWIIERKREVFLVSGAVCEWRSGEENLLSIFKGSGSSCQSGEMPGGQVPTVRPVPPLSVWLVGPQVPLPSSFYLPGGAK